MDYIASRAPPPSPLPQEIASALAYLHAQNILHGDLSPGNVLLCVPAPEAKRHPRDTRPFCAKVCDVRGAVRSAPAARACACALGLGPRKGCRAHAMAFLPRGGNQQPRSTVLHATAWGARPARAACRCAACSCMLCAHPAGTPLPMVQVSDFGLSRVVETQEVKTATCGTGGWRCGAPGGPAEAELVNTHAPACATQPRSQPDS